MWSGIITFYCYHLTVPAQGSPNFIQTIQFAIMASVLKNDLKQPLWLYTYVCGCVSACERYICMRVGCVCNMCVTALCEHTYTIVWRKELCHHRPRYALCTPVLKVQCSYLLHEIFFTWNNTVLKQQSTKTKNISFWHRSTWCWSTFNVDANSANFDAEGINSWTVNSAYFVPTV